MVWMRGFLLVAVTVFAAACSPEPCEKSWEHLSGLPNWQNDWGYLGETRAVFIKGCKDMSDADHECLRKAKTSGNEVFENCPGVLKAFAKARPSM